MYRLKKRNYINWLLCAIMILCMIQPSVTTKAAMAKGSKWVGNVIAGNVPSNYLTYWNQVTPENGSKWGSVEGRQDTMSWGNVDTIYKYAKSNGIPFKFHTLVWGSQYPNWITNLSQADQKAEVLEWIKAAGEKYPDSEYVDVVNEPLHSPAPYRNAIGGSGSTGWDWIVWSFEQAREAFPNSKLLINEYGIISDPNAANNYVKIINILKNKGLVDGIGIQCHQFNMDTVSVSTMKSVLNTLGATGLPIYVSELDITGDDNTQLNRYKEKFPVLYESPYVKGITLWGYIYNTTWISNTWLTNSSGGERPALTWLKQYLASASAEPTSTTKPSNTPTQVVKNTATPIPTIPVVPSTGDLNNDGVINMSDVMLLASAFNSARGDSRYVGAYDLNNDGAVNMTDVMIIAAKFNTLVTRTNTPTVTPKPTPTPTSVSPSSNRPSYRKVGNPYLPGWEYIPDGEPRVFGDRVYVYGSHDNANSKKFCDTKLRVWSAPLDDLENWRDEGDAFHSKADDEGKDDLPYTDNDLYAPDVVEKGGKYYLYYYVVGAPGGVAVSDSPAGPFKYLSKYGNGNNKTFEDPGVLVDTDGSVYMYYGFQGSYMCQIDPKDMYTILPNSTINNLLSTSAPFYFFEAASMRKVGDTYYLIYSPNNATTTLVYATSKSPKGPFKYGGTIINSGKNYPGANDHGSICNINGQWYIFYHRMTNNTMYSRKGCVEKINILPDGSIPEVEMTSMGFSKSLSPYQSNPADLSCYLTGGNYSTEVDTNTRPVINNKNNAVIGFKYFDFTRTDASAQTTFSAKIRYGQTSGKMEIRLDNPNSGTLIGTLNIGSKSGDTNWYTLTTDVSSVTGSHALYFKFTGGANNNSICDIASFEFK